MSKKYIELEQAIKKIGLIGNLADFIKDVICDELTELPTIEVSEDCISREDLLKHAYKREGVMSVSVDSIKLAPSVVPSRAEGEWLLDGRCSECLVSPLTTHKNYCPNCGAKMKG